MEKFGENSDLGMYRRKKQAKKETGKDLD